VLVEPPSQDTSIRWSYDRESDAQYVRVATARGQVQRSSTARRHLDSSSRLVQLLLGSIERRSRIGPDNLWCGRWGAFGAVAILLLVAAYPGAPRLDWDIQTGHSRLLVG
jgi:hypothetical protein